MPKKVVPFIQDYRFLDGEREDLRMRQESVPFYHNYWTLEGESILHERFAEPGQEFIKRFGIEGIEARGVFRDIKEVFDAELRVGERADYQKSTVYMIDEKNNVEYVMYPEEFFDMTRRADIKRGRVQGSFAFAPKGQAVSLLFVG